MSCSSRTTDGRRAGSAQQETFDMIQAFTGQGNVLAVPRPLAQYMGSLEGGVFLSQLIYWSDRGRDGQWFYKSHEEWEAETMLSEYKVRKFSKVCRERGFLETELRRVNGAPTLHYRLDFRRFTEAFTSFLRHQGEVPPGPDPEKSQNGISNIGETAPDCGKFENRIPEISETESEKFQNRFPEISDSISTKTTTEITRDHGQKAPPTHPGPAAPEVLFSKPLWQETKRELALQMAKATYSNLLQEAQFGGVEGQKVIIHVPNWRAAEWINRRLAAVIARTAGYVAGCQGLTVEARTEAGAEGGAGRSQGAGTSTGSTEGTRPGVGTKPTPTSTTTAWVGGRAGREPP